MDHEMSNIHDIIRKSIAEELKSYKPDTQQMDMAVGAYNVLLKLKDQGLITTFKSRITDGNFYTNHLPRLVVEYTPIGGINGTSILTEFVIGEGFGQMVDDLYGPTDEQRFDDAMRIV